MRILLVGPGSNYKFGARFYYNYTRRLQNGFIRSGHFVLQFSDRDHADYALGNRSIGRYLAKRRLREMAHSLQPHLLCLVHADLIDNVTVQAIKAEVPGCRVAVVDFDLQSLPEPAARLRRALEVADYGFSTTGGQVLRNVAAGRHASFIPNLIDVSMDDQAAYEGTHKDADVFFCSLRSSKGPQWRKAFELRDLAPDLRYAFYGMDRQNGLWGHNYMATMARSCIGLNFNQSEGALYASDRMAQYLGNGMLLATDRASGYQRYFNDDEMLFYSGLPELAERCREVVADGSLWRTMARKGREKSMKVMSNALVSEFILRTTLGEPPPAGWIFSQHGD